MNNKMLKSMPLLISVVMLLALPAQSNAALTCTELLSKISSEAQENQDIKELPQIGKQYLVQFAGDPTIRILKFNGLVESDNKIFVELSEGPERGKVIYRVLENDVVEWREPKSDGDIIGKIITFPISQALLARNLGKLIFKSFRLLAKNEDAVEVIGTLTSPKSIGQKIANQLQKFDHLMTMMGFVRPKLTRVFVGSQPILPTLQGPFSLSYPTLNIWSDKGSAPFIAMNPIFWKTKPVRSDGILYHERTHSLLYRTYNKKAFVNKSSAIQEALADFSAAHMTGSSKIGQGLGGESAPIRDIESRTAQFGGIKKTRQSILDVEGDSYHNNSMMVSHILWRLREIIGAEAINYVFKPLVDDLNIYRPSYDDLLKKEGRPLKEKRQQFIYDLEYVLAVILKSSADWKSAAEVKMMINESANELNFSLERIRYVSSHLTKSTEDYSYDSSGEMRQTIITTIYGAAGFLVDASIILWLSGIF